MDAFFGAVAVAPQLDSCELSIVRRAPRVIAALPRPAAC
jgi:hypothetical protein